MVLPWMARAEPRPADLRACRVARVERLRAASAGSLGRTEIVSALISAGKRTGQSMESFSPGQPRTKLPDEQIVHGAGKMPDQLETTRNQSLNRPGRSPEHETAT